MPEAIPNSTNSPMSEYLLKLQLIVSNAEFKDKSEARKYETIESSLAGDQYVHAVKHTDSFESYTYNSHNVYNILSKLGLSDQTIMRLIADPVLIPQNVKKILMEDAREACISTYKESNKYYVMLTGKPFEGNKEVPADKILTIPDEFYEIYKGDDTIYRDQPIHELPDKYQELFMNTSYYKQMLVDNPDARYLRYIGSNAIPIEVSRPARDGDIMKINTSKLSTYHPVFGNVVVTPDIVHKYVNVYRETRDYVYGTLRGDFSAIYANYDSFVRFLTIYLSIGNTMNEFMKSAAGYIHMNNITANNLFMLYGLPSVIMEGSSMINFLKKFRLLLMDKGTNIVYRVKDLIGYKDTDIYTLVMVKQQVFENGVPIFEYKDGKAIPKQNIFFRRLGTTEDNTSYFKYRDSTVTYGVDEITSGDPRWWNTPEVEAMLQDMNYTLSNSKYIQLSTHLSMTDIWWQCVILLRGLLDNNSETKFTRINVNYNIDDSSEMSVFDAVLTLIILMNHQFQDFQGRRAKGNLYIPNGVYNGKNACIDMLFNGLNIAQLYTPLTPYDKGAVVGPTLSELYTVVDDYVSSDKGIQYDVEQGHLERYTSKWDEGSPKALVPGSPFKVASFNYNIKNEDPLFYASLWDKEYLEPERFMNMLENILNRTDNNIGMSLMSDVKNVYKYLENKLVQSTTISQFRQVTDTYNKLFLVDPLRNWDSGSSDNIDELLKEEYGITDNEYESLKRFFSIDINNPDLVVRYNEKDYPIYLETVLNMSVYNIPINDEYPFRDDRFIEAFDKAMRSYRSEKLEKSNISRVIKKNYQNIIIDKVEYDASNTSYGPKTFEALLRVSNVSLYKYIKNLLKKGDSSIALIMRSIVKALEDYVNAPLSGLEFSALGVDNYFRVLKEVITYFKSYMVEFTKDEFVYLFDGLFDNGGNSNMLRLYDETVAGEYIGVPKDSLTLFDASTATVIAGMKDDNSGRMLQDECLFRVEGTYKTFKDSGYELLFDDGSSITHKPFDGLTDDTIITGDIVSNTTGTTPAYKIIINIATIKKEKQYYGNIHPQ